MASTFVPGYLAEVSVGGTSVEPSVASGNMTFSYNVIDKPVAGAQLVTSIRGLERVTMSVSGHVSVEEFDTLQAASVSNSVVAYVFQIGEDGGGTDIGEYAGNMLIENFNVAFDADDEWSFSLDAKIQSYTYTTANP